MGAVVTQFQKSSTAKTSTGNANPEVCRVGLFCLPGVFRGSFSVSPGKMDSPGNNVNNWVKLFGFTWTVSLSAVG